MGFDAEDSGFPPHLLGSSLIRRRLNPRQIL